MDYYLIKESLCPCQAEEVMGNNCQFAALATWKE